MPLFEKIISKMTTADKAIEIASIVMLIYFAYFIVTTYSTLPDTIPTHFGIDGKADAWGNKATIFILPSITLFVYLLLTGISLLPSNMLNYPVKIDNENKERQHLLALKLLRILKLSIISLFFYISFSIVNSIDSANQTLGDWFLPLFLVIIFSPIIYYIRKAIKIK